MTVTLLLIVVGLSATAQDDDDRLPDQATPFPPFATPAATPGGVLPGAPAIRLELVTDGLVDPVNIAAPPDGSGRLFVVERLGHIRVIARDGTLLADSFLDLTRDVEHGHLEQGLLGLAFDPDYGANGYVYVSYTDYLRNGDLRLVRYTVAAEDPNRADPTSAKPILTVAQPYRYHNGGELLFGPDGYLYVGIGDGGFAQDPYEAEPPSVLSLLGKIVRLDVHPEDDAVPYLIPPDNPWVHFGDARLETWVHGLRNPWQFDFDDVTGELYIADVGAGGWEEVNVQPADSPGGEHYGWDVLEGTYCWPLWRETCRPVGEPPVAQYAHLDGNCAIVGIGVYRGSRFPTLDGLWFNGDFCSGRIWGLARTAGGDWVYQELLDTELLITSGGKDEAGELYLTSWTSEESTEEPNGAVWQIVAAEATPVARSGTEPVAPATAGAVVPPADPLPVSDRALPPRRFGARMSVRAFAVLRADYGERPQRKWKRL